MSKFIMNKNVMHNGKAYAVNTEIGQDDAGFEDLKQAGHATEVEDEASEKIVDDPKSAWEPVKGSDSEVGLSQDQSDEQSKPAKKSKK